MNPESERLQQAHDPTTPWKKWGPYLSERQWGTVREDYSDNGNAWDYFRHEHSHARAYRWGEDGLAGISDDGQRLCFALALWNGKDPVLKERLFDLTNSQGNHGEDVKECYYYLDSTPTHSYMRYLYKYPQAAFPYAQLVETNQRRSRQEFEYELINTGVFDQDRYFDVFVEYAKESPEDILAHITIHNRGPEAAEIHVLPTLWFRNRWSWGDENPRPLLQAIGGQTAVVRTTDPELGERYLYRDAASAPAPGADGASHAPDSGAAAAAGGARGHTQAVCAPQLIFTENETNHERLFSGKNRSPFVKDGIINCVVHQHFDEVLQTRRQEADTFYASVIPASLDPDAANVMRQALAGMLWSKQYYHFDVNRWLEERGCDPYQPARKTAPRNAQWHHMYNAYYGNDFTVECPTGSGRPMNLYQIVEELSRRLSAIFLKEKDGRRPVNGGESKLQEDRLWRDYIPFYEYFHGDNGAGLGASHQTGWTGLIARALHLFATTTAAQVLELGKVAAVVEVEKPA